MARAMAATRPQGARIGLPLGMSMLLHGSVVAAAILLGGRSGAVTAPVYNVTLVAAPAGPRQVGVVTDEPETPNPPPTPPKRANAAPDEARVPKKAPPTRKPTPKATVTPDARSAKRTDAAPKAGGGPEGGKGADVANINTGGIAFAYPEYLQNIVRQIALRFRPRNAGALRAEVMFLIRRDGSVTGIQLRTRSGSMPFDLEAMGAVESAAPSFGRLPDGYREDVLTVIFSFDPQLIR